MKNIKFHIRKSTNFKLNYFYNNLLNLIKDLYVKIFLKNQKEKI